MLRLCKVRLGQANQSQEPLKKINDQLNVLGYVLQRCIDYLRSSYVTSYRLD